MRLTVLACSGLFSAFLSASGVAGPVQDLTTFTPGTPARASEVNGNFEALKSAVNDNDERLSSVESGKQNRITGSCEPGMAVTAVGADGSVTCEPWRSSEGVFTVGNDAFRSTTGPGLCDYVSTINHGYFTGDEYRSCEARALLQLPDGVDITGFTCLVLDNMPGVRRIEAALLLYETGILFDGTWGDRGIAETASSTGTSLSSRVERLSADAPSGLLYRIVDNSRYYYRISVTFYSNGDPAVAGSTFDSVGGQLRLLGCSVRYRY